MFTPKQLYYYYTIDPCEIGGLDSITGMPEQDAGKGTPYSLGRLANFLKQLKYPCYNKAPNGILNTGKDKLGLPYRILSKIDVEAFTEVQPDIQSGTAMSIRNACDIARACTIETNKAYEKWNHRMGYEYLRFFGQNQITNCLMMLGPDLVTEDIALKRGTGCGDLDCLPRAPDPNAPGSAIGAAFRCAQRNGKMVCTPCAEECEYDQEEENSSDNQEGAGCAQKMNVCCGDVPGERQATWKYGPSNAQINSKGVVVIEDTNEEGLPLMHGGVLIRKSYGGYVNLLNNTGSTLHSCPGDSLLRYIQRHNGYNYKTNQSSTSNTTSTPIERMKTISMIISNNITSSIKDLVYNGYGVVIMTNVGFSNQRDSTGLSFPDRIWYHTFSVIGYDDRKKDYEDCVFLLANTWGKWNEGGHPSWGPIPDGSFLVTEHHLNCMLHLYRVDLFNCRKKRPGGPLNTPVDVAAGCIGDEYCTPWGCNKHQTALGFAFALSMTDGFPRQVLDYDQFYTTKQLDT